MSPESFSAPAHPLLSDTARHRVEMFAVASGPIFTLSALIGWLVLGQGLVPFDPSLAPRELAGSYAANALGIKLGCTIFLVGCGFLTLWVAQLGVMMASLEGRRPVLAVAQVLGGFGVVAFVSTACCLWIGAAYRVGASPDVTVALNDAGWFTFLLTWPGLSVQMAAVGLVIWFARHRPDRLAPGWVAIYCFVGAVVVSLVGAPAFAQTGPFAWNGPLGYYIPFTVWAVFFEILSWFMLRSLRREHRAGATEPVSDRPAGSVAGRAASTARG